MEKSLLVGGASMTGATGIEAALDACDGQHGWNLSRRKVFCLLVALVTAPRDAVCIWFVSRGTSRLCFVVFYLGKRLHSQPIDPSMNVVELVYQLM